MNRRARMTIRTWMIASVLAIPVRSEAEEVSVDDRTPFGQVAQELSALLKLRIQDGRLALDRNHWEEANKALGLDKGDKEDESNVRVIRPGVVQMRVRKGMGMFGGGGGDANNPPEVNLYQALQSKAQAAGIGGGSSGYSGSGNELEYRFSGGQLSGRLRRSGGTSVEMSFAESGDSKRAITVSDETEAGGKGLDLQLRDLQNGRTLILQSLSGGRTMIAYFSGAEAHAYSGESFSVLQTREPAFVGGTLIPMLRAYGFIPPMTEFSMEVIGSALESVIGQGQRGAVFVADMLKRLDAEDFDVREKAKQELSAQYFRWAHTLTEMEKAPLSAEVQSSLDLFRTRFAERRSEAGELVKSMKLNSSPSYFIKLLAHNDASIQLDAHEALVKITGKDLGMDPSAWKEFSSSGSSPILGKKE